MQITHTHTHTHTRMSMSKMILLTVFWPFFNFVSRVCNLPSFFRIVFFFIWHSLNRGHSCDLKTSPRRSYHARILVHFYFFVHSIGILTPPKKHSPVKARSKTNQVPVQIKTCRQINYCRRWDKSSHTCSFEDEDYICNVIPFKKSIVIFHRICKLFCCLLCVTTLKGKIVRSSESTQGKCVWQD